MEQPFLIFILTPFVRYIIYRYNFINKILYDIYAFFYFMVYIYKYSTEDKIDTVEKKLYNFIR